MDIGEVILLIICVGSWLFWGMKEHINRKKREGYEWWLSDIRECIHSIECEFRRNCQNIAKNRLSQKRLNDFEYYDAIRTLEKKYKEELTDRIIAQKRVRVTTIPESLVREYERNISDIADTFIFFWNLYKNE